MGGDTPAAARPEVDAFELAGTGMLVTDESGLILRANRTYCDLVGRGEREVVGQPFLHAFPKPAQPLVPRSLKAALRPGALPPPSPAAPAPPPPPPPGRPPPGGGGRRAGGVPCPCRATRRWPAATAGRWPCC